MVERPRDSFPRQSARTQRFSLGRPRSFTVAPDGSRVVFLRSAAGDDPLTSLWVFDVEAARERLIFDARQGSEENLTAEERARRERVRESGAGVVAYTTDRDVTLAAFAVGSTLYLADLVRGGARQLPATEPVFAPAIDPTGRRVAYVSEGSLRVVDLDGEDRLLAEEEDAAVSWGLAEFVAAEEMQRREGFWWSPEGDRVAVARVDESPVEILHIFDAIDPASAPRPVRYPRAGTANADVSLHLVGLDGDRTEVRWDRRAFEYLARVVWTRGAPLILLVQSRDQRTTRILEVAGDGSTGTAREDTDDAWVELVEGSPRQMDDGRLVHAADVGDTRRLFVDDEAVTSDGLHVRRILDAGDAVTFTAAEDDPTEEHVWRWSAAAGLERVSRRPGVHDAATGGEVTVLTSATIDEPVSSTVLRKGEAVATLTSLVELPLVEARPTLFVAGERELRCALLTPGGVQPDAPLPVLLDPYGGPWFQRVTKARDQYLESQWFADQGFAVLVIDGRGTPSRGRAWEREVHRDVFGPVVEDQVDGLRAAAERFRFLDLSRVAIRGWSFGGELAAFAVLRHPDVFRAAVAGAPVTDQTLYDTHYTERYLGRPDEDPEAYRRNSAVGEAERLERPLMLIHGVVDDNVLVANSLRFSRELTEAGRPHMFLPLSSITHAPREESAAENLLRLELRFLRESLGLAR